MCMKKDTFWVNNLLKMVILSFCIMSCASVSIRTYSFAENENEAVKIVFLAKEELIGKDIHGVRFISFEGVSLPEPEKKTQWGSTIGFPAGRPLQLKLNVFVQGKKSDIGTGTLLDFFILPVIAVNEVGGEMGATLRTYNRDILFDCPALEAGKTYTLEFKDRALVKDILILRNAQTKKVVYEFEFEAR